MILTCFHEPWIYGTTIFFTWFFLFFSKGLQIVFLLKLPVSSFFKSQLKKNYLLERKTTKKIDSKIEVSWKHLMSASPKFTNTYQKREWKKWQVLTTWLKKRTFSICKFGLSKKREKLKKSFARFNVNGLLTPWSLFRDRDYTCTDCCEVLSLDSQSYRVSHNATI